MFSKNKQMKKIFLIIASVSIILSTFAMFSVSPTKRYRKMGQQKMSKLMRHSIYRMNHQHK